MLTDDHPAPHAHEISLPLPFRHDGHWPELATCRMSAAPKSHSRDREDISPNESAALAVRLSAARPSRHRRFRPPPGLPPPLPPSSRFEHSRGRPSNELRPSRGILGRDRSGGCRSRGKPENPTAGRARTDRISSPRAGERLSPYRLQATAEAQRGGAEGTRSRSCARPRSQPRNA